MDIGAAIKQLRIKNGLTQQQLAGYLNVSMQTVSRWETSAIYPDITLLPILAKHFHVTVDSLFEIGGDKMNPIESTRLRIRPWNESDAQGLFQIKKSSKNFMYYLTISTERESAEHIKIWQKYQEMYPIILKETDKLIGVVGLVDINRYPGYRELEVHICDPLCNQDYMTEAHKLMLSYGFTELGISIASSYCGCEDEILKQALIQSGFTCEGTLRKFGRDQSDRMRFSILKEEYRP